MATKTEEKDGSSGRETDIIDAAYAKAGSGIQERWLLDEPAQWHAYVAALPTRLQVTYTIVVLHLQVFNGTFDQYFSNRYGLLFAPFAAVAFRKIGAAKRAAIVEKAIGLLKENGQNAGLQWGAEATSVKPLLPVLNDPVVSVPLEALSDEYIDDEEEDVATLLSAYLRQ